MTRAVLVLNAGSSSLKACVIDTQGVCRWRDQRPWHPEADAVSTAASAANQDREGALEAVLADWLPRSLAPWLAELRLVGHRVVHGGERFLAPTRLTPSVLAELEALLPLAPLHNGPALRAIRWLGARWPQLDAWACFDTAFHADLPLAARTYALPQAWRAHGQHRYGFHGLNHQHLSEVVASQPWAAACRPLRLISCHLGAGCSVAAILDGRSIATTMGFTPLEGVVMASRSGSVDPGLLLHLLRHNVSVEELEAGLNRASGLLGLSGLSGDMASLRQATAQGHAGARLAIEVFRHSLLQAIGAMAACLKGVDGLALSGGIGQHDEALQAELRQELAWLGAVRWLVIPADEEGVIARSCLAAARRQPP